MKKLTLEISTYNLNGVKAAKELGADRVELCDNIKEGGTTPSYGFVKMALEVNHPEVFIIIRPRGGDFLYSDSEMEIMKRDIVEAKNMGVNGVVSGVLLPNGDIDIVRTKELIELSRPMKFTFHRAFDMTRDYKKSLKTLIDLGVDIVLTSGMEDKATDGIEVLKNLVEIADGKIDILAGSGVNASNIEQLYTEANITNFHMSAVKGVESEMTFFNKRLNMGNVKSEEYIKLDVDIDKIKDAVNAVSSLEKINC